MSDSWIQRTIQLPAVPRGCHLVTRHVIQALPEMAQIRIGLLHLFLQHTSASLCINENADPDVRDDLDSALDRIVPEDQSFTHTLEGPDDMPAHVKSTLVGCDLTIPIAQGRLLLGTWQGVYLCEHRDRAGPRQLALTAWGRLS